MLFQSHWSFTKNGCDLISSTPFLPNRWVLKWWNHQVFSHHTWHLRLGTKQQIWTDWKLTCLLGNQQWVFWHCTKFQCLRGSWASSCDPWSCRKYQPRSRRRRVYHLRNKGACQGQSKSFPRLRFFFSWSSTTLLFYFILFIFLGGGGNVTKDKTDKHNKWNESFAAQPIVIETEKAPLSHQRAFRRGRLRRTTSRTRAHSSRHRPETWALRVRCSLACRLPYLTAPFHPETRTHSFSAFFYFLFWQIHISASLDFTALLNALPNGTFHSNALQVRRQLHWQSTYLVHAHTGTKISQL